MSTGPVTDQRAFEDAWPDAAYQVERTLRRRGVDPDTTADVVQETAVRAWAKITTGSGFDSPQGLVKWAQRVAGNLVTDSWRTERRLVPGHVEPTVDDVAEAVTWRVLLEATAQQMERLPVAQRQALLALLSGDIPDEKRAQVRESVRRLRARAQLRRTIGRLPGGWLWRRLRYIGGTAAVGTACTVLVAVAPVENTSQAPVRVAAGPGQTASTATLAGHTPAGGATAGIQRHHHTTPILPTQPRAPQAAQPPVVHQAVAAVPSPMGGQVEVGTRPDDAQPFVCVETAWTPALCMAKPRELVNQLHP